MNIELRKVCYSPSLSEETNAFTADVWVDGKKAGTAGNHGTGGPTNVHPPALRQRLDDYGKTLPQMEIDDGSGSPAVLTLDAEMVIDEMLIDWIHLRDLRKRLKNRLLYVRTGERGIMQTKVMPPEVMAKVLASPDYKAKWGVATWLNSVPEAEALALYRAHD